MAYTNPSDYGNIENRRSEQAKILKWKKRVFYGVSFMFSLIIVQFVFSNGRDLLSPAQFFVNWGNIYDNSVFYTLKYLATGACILLILYMLFAFPSKKGLIRKIEILSKRNKKPSLILLAQLKIISKLDIFVFYIMYPISYFIFNLDYRSKKNFEKFYFRIGWLEHIELSFFKEEAVKVDSYNRAKELNLLKNYKELFSSKKGEAIYGCPVYNTIYKIFLSEHSMKDLMKIIEGYLADKDEPKFDKNLTASEYKELLKEKFDGKIENFRCYDGKDEILFSIDLIKELIDSETERFRDYMYKYTINSRQTFTRVFLRNYNFLKQDDKIMKKIANYNLPNIVDIEDLKENGALLTSRIIELCCVYFRVIAFKHIVGQYMNIPAGTTVVKLEDYTMRMIVETYDDEVLIQIIKGKNDGSSKEFNSDALVNIFLAAYNYFNLSSGYSFVDKVHDIFNFRSDAIDEIENTLNGNNMTIDSFSEGYRMPTSEELAYMKENYKDNL